ncbi:MAG: two-component system VirA-like sensor kinase [Rhodopila sp.]
MKPFPLLAAILLLLPLLTWLSLRAFNGEAELFDRALGELDHFATVENALQRDVLRVRLGELRNYDPLVRETNELDRSMLRLREAAVLGYETTVVIDRAAASTARQGMLVETFKSNNALLQNSLAYFGRYCTRLGASDLTGTAVPAASGLATAMLRLTLDTSPEAAHEVEIWLNELATQPAPPGQAAAVRALLAHGRLLHQLLPATNAVMKALRAVPQSGDWHTLRAEILTHQAESRATARGFRLMLYVASLLLVALLLYLGIQLRARALALYRRAAFEHVIAGISTRLINVRSRALGSHVVQVLAELAGRVGADRAYFVPEDRALQQHTWSRDGLALPASWPDRAVELAARFRPTAEGIIDIPCVDQLPPGEEKDVLIAAGLQGWTCVPGPGPPGAGFILGFDAVRRERVARSGELGLLRMALDAVANAVRRDALEQEAMHLEQRLQQSRRMETIGALASGIAHNFNNIVAAILGYAEMAEARVEAGSQSARDIAQIHRAGERAQDLVNQLLAFGRHRSTHREPVPVHDLLAEAVSLLHASLPPRINLVVHDEAGPAVIVGERGQLQQVILNLCNNASQAMDGCGCIRLETSVHDVARMRPLSHGDLAPGRYVCIAVSDTGHGIDRLVLKRIFEPFFTTRAAGSGLGLATVQEIVAEHRGVMHVHSRPQAGSRFEAWLPRAAADAPAPIDAKETAPFGDGETVLVLDEEPEQLARDEEIVAALGYEPVGFVRTADALAACRQTPKRFDILVLGYVTPPASALDIAAAIHATVPDVPIVLAAPWGTEIAADSLVTAGICDVVPWPLVATEIAGAIADSMERCRGNRD